MLDCDMMPFEPDIIVTTPEPIRVALVADAMLQIDDQMLPIVERQLKRYMVGMRCPIGLLITPERIRLYRDLYTSESEDSVERIGEYPAGGIFGKKSWDDEASFADEAQAWLDRLNEESSRRTLPKTLRDAVEENLLPELTRGPVRAAGPRGHLHGIT